MKSTVMKMAAAILLSASTATAACTVGCQLPVEPAQINSQTRAGCFSSSGDLKLNSTLQYNAKLSCTGVCMGDNKLVSAMMGANQCFCGDTLPPQSSLVADTECNVPCPGYPSEACGGRVGIWTVYNNGIQLDIPSAGSTPNTTTTSTSADTTSGEHSTVTVTSPPNNNSPTTTNTPSTGGSSNTVAVAVGVVVAIVVVLGLLVGAWFYMRRRKIKQLEDEHRRNAAVNSFISGSKPPSSSGGFSITDSRLDPVMAQRRVSNGSIADNQDYSRKILRVTNA